MNLWVLHSAARRFNLPLTRGVSRMSVMEVISLLILITNIVALVVTICKKDKK